MDLLMVRQQCYRDGDQRASCCLASIMHLLHRAASMGSELSSPLMRLHSPLTPWPLAVPLIIYVICITLWWRLWLLLQHYLTQ